MNTYHKVSCDSDPSTVFRMMPRKKSPAEMLRQVNERASGKDKCIINDERAARDKERPKRKALLVLVGI
jgi:hypothetical protein